jgi:hypothetical protein
MSVVANTMIVMWTVLISAIALFTPIEPGPVWIDLLARAMAWTIYMLPVWVVCIVRKMWRGF